MKVVFLDRDGTLIVDPSDAVVDSADKIELFPDTIEALQYLASNDFAVIIITNQAGIAAGRMNNDEFWVAHNALVERLAVSGVTILNTYMNNEADVPDASDWRKPGPNMLFQAAIDFELNLKDIYMVGDNVTDVHAAITAGCKGGILVKTATNKEVESQNAVFTATHLMDAARFITNNS